MTLFSQPQKYIFMTSLLSPSGILQLCAHFQQVTDVEQFTFLVAITDRECLNSEVIRDKLTHCNSCMVG